MFLSWRLKSCKQTIVTDYIQSLLFLLNHQLKRITNVLQYLSRILIFFQSSPLSQCYKHQTLIRYHTFIISFNSWTDVTELRINAKNNSNPLESFLVWMFMSTFEFICLCLWYKKEKENMKLCSHLCSKMIK